MARPGHARAPAFAAIGGRALPSQRPFPTRATVTAGVLGGAAALASLAARPLGLPLAVTLAAGTVEALAVACVVALFVARDRPVVARVEARLARLFTPPRRLRLTREGRFFIGITLGVGFAAINTGNNLLYLLLGMLLSLIIASGLLSESTLRDLRVSRQLPARVHAGDPALVTVRLGNRKPRLPSFAVELEDTGAGEPIDRRCFFLKVPAGRELGAAYRHTFAARGLKRFLSVRASTRFPFGLFEKSRVIDAPGELLVYPALVAVDARLAAPPSRDGERANGATSRRGEFFGLREYREGDDARDVHWRSSAKRGRLLVREHEEEESRRVTLYVDNALPGGAACPSVALTEALERAVSLAASLALLHLSRGHAVRLVARGESLAFVRGVAAEERVLRLLALLGTVDEAVPFATAPGSDGPSAHEAPIYVARRGAPPPPAALGHPHVLSV